MKKPALEVMAEDFEPTPAIRARARSRNDVLVMANEQAISHPGRWIKLPTEYRATSVRTVKKHIIEKYGLEVVAERHPKDSNKRIMYVKAQPFSNTVAEPHE